MKRKREREETTTEAPTSNSHDGGSEKGYEVFLNFRGPDTRLTIVDTLYNNMIRMGIRTFKDNEELRFGEKIEGGLLQAIKDSKIYILIFSKNYSSSKWCLRELAHIVELSRDNDEKVILPIFYDVDVNDVKLETELYQKALRKHKNISGKDVAKNWKMALREVGKIKGRNLKDHGLDELKNLIIKEVSSLLWTRQTDVPNHLVGFKDRMDEIMKQFDLEAFDVRFIVVHGMGGIGKTTLAEAVFRQISPQFEGHCCFLKDVRTRDIIYLQNKLLSDILQLSCTNISFIDEGVDMIKMRLHGKKVLIVLDDIDNRDQLMRLAGEPNWYGGGSRIIITTRNIEFLAKEGEDDNVLASDNRHFSFYTMPEMNWDDALQLFCDRALGCAKPSPDYMDITEKLISALGGLPLALDVIGSTLRGKCQSTWEDALCKLKKVMNEDVKKKLMISYEALEPNQQQIYLDIACFFINNGKTTAVKYWDAVFGYPTRIELNILKRMSLIKIFDDDTLWMHDQLRDLARNIVHPESQEIHVRGSRLWSPKDAFRVVQREMGTKDIVALNLGTPKPDKMYRFKHKQFVGLVNLKFLRLDHGNFEGDFKDIFSELRWLSWSHCPSEFQGTNFGLKNLAVLMLSGNNITENWEGWSQIMVAKQLKVLQLKDCPSLRKTPKFSTISRLERLILRCAQLRKIDKSISNLQHLDYLEIESRRFAVLPNSVGNLVKVKHLNLRCPKLQKLPNSIGKLELLLELDVKFSEIRELPHSIGNLKRLKVLKITNCKLKKLPASIGNLQSLVKLDLQESDIMSLPNCIENLKMLKVLNLNFTNISEIPKTIGMLENLKELCAFGCKYLEGEIPSEIGALSALDFLDLSLGHFSRLPTTINQLTNLQELRLSFCYWIQQLPKLPKTLRLLRFSLTSLTTIPDLSNLTNLLDLDMRGAPVQQPNIEWLAKLCALRKLALVVEDMTLPPINLSSLSQLQDLEITCVDSQSLTGLPSNLQRLTLVDVQSPIDWSLFSNLENLSDLMLHKYQLGEIRFDVIGKFKKFNELRMWECPLLKTLPVLPCLKEIRRLCLMELPQLTKIQGLEELKSLRDFFIRNCNSIKWVSETSLSKLQNLNRLEFYGCGSLEGVPDLPHTKTSCHLTIKECSRLSNFDGPYPFRRDGQRFFHL
ncbi:hypothetical protein ACJRO7_020781 [Eucalyptus globulus]|uniref:TIR domain-containing protein n=1 Tax=Eucalyptus globulus TaxID=34317 RepID=A0ABD3KNU8_EUCGL